jgi:hypothetical protein
VDIAVLRRVGVVLVAVGCLGAFLTTRYGSGMWLATYGLDALAIVAGGVLSRGGMRAARWVRMAMAIALGASAMAAAGLPFIQPPQLSLTELSLEPASFIWPAAAAIAAVGVELWIWRELGRTNVQAALSGAGSRLWDDATAAKAGAAAILLAIGLRWLSLHGDSAAVAVSLAREQLGPDYRYALTSIGSTSKDGHKSVQGVVTAWNDNEIKTVILHWVER